MRYTILFFMAVLTCLSGFAQGDYNPENPGDPNPFRKLTVVATPTEGGSVNPGNGTQIGVGQTVICRASANRYYEFVHWIQKGNVVSTEQHFSFVMPDEDVEMTAVFEPHYNPESPGDPQESKVTHKLILTALPANGGRFNLRAVRPWDGDTLSVYTRICEGDSIDVYAYPNEGYRFGEWLLDGVLATTRNPLRVKMTDRDLHFTARFTYNPANPTDPGANVFNPATGEMVVDRFEPGYLSSAISTLLNDSYKYADIHSLVICGRMDVADFGVFDYLTGCTLTDLSRTSGYDRIPSFAFAGATALTEVMLPACITGIGRGAFEGCGSLSVLTCHAVMPPVLDEDVFEGTDKALVIKVPLQSVDIYRNAQGWKDFTILPANTDVQSITVSLPQDATDGRYRNMSIELTNTDSGQRYKYLVTDKVKYVFGNLLTSTRYSVAVKNGRNEILGEIKNLEIADKDLTAEFVSLRQPGKVRAEVLTPAGDDFTDNVTIKWFNEAGELLLQGPTLSGMLENAVVTCAVTLPDVLQRLYKQSAPQTVTVTTQGQVTCRLAERGKRTVSGKVCDAEGVALSGAIVTVSENINGSYTNSETLQCDREGRFETETAEVPLKMTVSANGYMSCTKELQTAADNAGEIVLEKTTGITLYPTYTFRESAAEGDNTPTSGFHSDGGNVAYRVEDMDGNEIAGCVYQTGSIVLPQNVAQGGRVNVMAYSKNNKFKETRQMVELTAKTINVSMDIVGYGGVSVTANTDDTDRNVCLLYDAGGVQLAKAAFSAGEATFMDVPDGQYSVVAMRRTALLGTVTNLASLRKTQLTEGSDYVTGTVNVVSGKVAEVAVGAIPELDETKLYYTDSRETYFMPNKSELTIGNYVTLKARMTVRDEYAAAVDAATLVVDVPRTCEFVDNSVISGSGYMGYEYVDNRLSVPVHNLSDAVRFCVVPLDGGECRLTAFIKLIIDNEEILQPIGSAVFEAMNFSIAAPEKTSKTQVAVRGTATADSEVLIYDNGTLAGRTYSMPDGEWATRITLHKPYTHSLHDVHAEIIDSRGRHLPTETRTVDYDQTYVDLSTITMIYGKDSFVFDQINGRTNARSYTYWVHADDTGYMPAPKFTFVADFTDNNPDIIKNVVFKVKMLNGGVRNLEGEYNVASGKWTATSQFSANKAPVNVTAVFDQPDTRNSYCEEAFRDQVDGLVNAANYLADEFENSVTLVTTVDEEDRFEGYMVYGDNRMPYRIELLDYDYAYGHLMNEKQFQLYGKADDKVYYNIESTDAEMVYTVIDSNEELALCITTGIETTGDAGRKRACWDWISPIRQSFNNGSFLQRFSGVMGNLLDIFSITEYLTVRGDFNLMMDMAVRYADNFIKLDKKSYELILAKCDDGTYRLGRGQMELADIERDGMLEKTENFSEKYYKYITDYQHALGWNVAGNIATLGVGKVISAGSKLIQKGRNVVRWWQRHVNGAASAETVGETVTNTLGIGLGGIQTGASEAINPAFYDFNGVRDKLWAWSYEEANAIIDEYAELFDTIREAYKSCSEEEEEEEDEPEAEVVISKKENFPAPPVTPAIDPSGYVYEAVPKNRIAGVTATAYFRQQEEDMYGDVTETAVVWDATAYGQENPLLTDVDGKYGWDVPAGMWQVRFEKDGYESAQSEWLPVPPPQLDVNIAMTQAKQPEVKGVHVYADGVIVEFDKFMLPTTLIAGNIAVMQDGRMVNGAVAALDMEADAAGNAFCSRIEYKFEDALADGEATVFVSRAVKSYANVNMGEDFIQVFTVEPRVTEIRTDRSVDVCSGSATRVHATVLPAAAAKGKTVVIESLNTMIADVSAERLQTDADGKVSFDVSGFIPGSTSVRISVDGCDVTALVNVNVSLPMAENQVAMPYASVESGEVKAGTEVYLYCDTKNATIYYSTDGSCPCDVTRHRYEGTPVVVDKDMTLKIMAEADGMEDSDVAEYRYTIDDAGIVDVRVDKEIEIYPLPVGEYLYVSASGGVIESVEVFNLNGRMVLRSDKQENRICLQTGFLSPGVYILNVRANGRTVMRKVIKE